MKYKPNNRLYGILLSASLVVIAGSFIVPASTRLFSLLIGIGCGGLASVVVAWLIDLSNCRQQEHLQQRILDQVFLMFDGIIPSQLQEILVDCAERDSGIDLEKQYTPEEVREILDDANWKDLCWGARYRAVHMAFEKVDRQTLLSNGAAPGIGMINFMLVQEKDQYDSFQEMNQRLGKDDSMVYDRLLQAIWLVNCIFSIRGKSIVIELTSEEKELIRKKRACLNKSDVNRGTE